MPKLFIPVGKSFSNSFTRLLCWSALFYFSRLYGLWEKMGPFFAVNLFLVNFSAPSKKRSIVNFDTWQLDRLLKIVVCIGIK